MRNAFRVTITAMIVTLVTLMARDVSKADSLTFQDAWDNLYVYTNGWGDHGAQDWGSGASFWGETKSYGLNDWYGTAIHWQESDVTGYIKCAIAAIGRSNSGQRRASTITT